MKNIIKNLGVLFIAACGFAVTVAAAEPGETAVVVYNSLLPDSKEVALHYADRRQVPSNQVFGLKLPLAEVMSRAEYREQLQKPLLKLLAERKLFTFEPGFAPGDKRGT